MEENRDSDSSSSEKDYRNKNSSSDSEEEQKTNTIKNKVTKPITNKLINIAIDTKENISHLKKKLKPNKK